MPNGSRLALVILAVQDLPDARKFYREAFGWLQIVDAPVYAEFELPGKMRLGLYERRSFSLNTGQMPLEVVEGQLSNTELYFYPDDLHAAIERLRAAGARMLSPLASRDWGDEAAYFADPCGNILVLARLIPDDAPLPLDGG